MKIFKNEVGRPSKETLKKRRNIKITITIVLIALFCTGIFLVSNVLKGNNEISGNGKNASTLSISYSNYSISTTTPSIGQKVTFKHTVSNIGTKKYYQKWTTYQDGKVVSQSSKCETIKANSGTSYVESDTLTAAPNGSSKYMNVTIYSDSKCSKKVVSANTKTFKWGSGSSGSGTGNVSISFSGYNTTSPKLGTKVTFKHTVKNAKNKYQKWFTYTGSSVTGKGSCQKITTNDYVENDSISSPSSTGVKKYLKVSIYSDSKCTKEVATQSSQILTWGSGSSGSGTGNVAISFSGYNTTSPKLGTKVTFKHTVKNAQNKYQKWFTYTDGKVTGTGSCQKITTNDYVENDGITSPSSISVKKYLKVTIYSDSSCKNIVASQNSQTLTWTGSTENKDGCGSGNITYTVAGKQYCTPAQHANYSYDKLKAQPSGDQNCLGYAVSYILAWTKGKYITNYYYTNVQDYYTKTTASSTSSFFDGLRTNIKNNYGTAVYVYNGTSEGEFEHYVAVIGILKSSLSKSSSNLSYSDFLIIDPYKKRIVNWQTIINELTGDNRKKVNNILRTVDKG